MTDPRLLADLTSRERQLIDAARAGTIVECGSAALGGLSGATDPDRVIRAEVLRELLLGRHGDLDPRGVRVRGARITGPFDLSHVRTQVGLALLCCHIDNEIQLRDTNLPWLVFRATAITTLFGHGMRVEGGVFLDRGFTAHASGDDAAISLNGAHIGGQLNLAGAMVRSERGPAVEADSCRADGGVFLNDGFTASSGSWFGTLRLLRAQIGVQLNASTARLVNSAGPALDADGIRIDGDTLLSEGFTADGDGDRGAVRLLGADIRGQLRLDGARLTNPSGPALGADRLRVEADVVLNECIATATGPRGVIRLPNTHIGGQLTALGAHLTNDRGPALDCQGLRIAGDLLLQDGFTATATDRAAVDLGGAQITGELDLRGARLINPSGPALVLMDLHAATVTLPVAVLCPHQAGDATECAGDRRVRADGFTYTALREIKPDDWLHVLHHHTAGYRAQPYQHLAAVERSAGHDGNARCILIAQQEDLRVRGQMISRPATIVHWLWGALAGYGYRTGRIAIALAVLLSVAGILGWSAGHTVTAPGHHAAEYTLASGQPGTPCSTIEQIGLGIDRSLPMASTGIPDRCDLNTTDRTGQLFTAASWLLQASIWALATLAIAGYTGLIRKIT